MGEKGPNGERNAYERTLESLEFDGSLGRRFGIRGRQAGEAVSRRRTGASMGAEKMRTAGGKAASEEGRNNNRESGCKGQGSVHLESLRSGCSEANEEHQRLKFIVYSVSVSDSLGHHRRTDSGS